MKPTPTERTAAGEKWHGIPIVAYHWEEPSGFSPPSSTEIDRVAFHWSTGPKDAEPLVRLKDVVGIADGYLCFHCGDRFTHDEARLHFGSDMDSVPACKIKGSEGGLLKALREAQQGWYLAQCELLGESGPALKAMRDMSRGVQLAVTSAEETGFQRGVDQCFDPIREALDVMREAVKACPIKQARPPIPSSCQKCGADRGDDCGLQLNAERTFGQTVMELVEGKSE